MSRPLELRPISNEGGEPAVADGAAGSGECGDVASGQIVLWAAQGYPVARIAEIGFTSEDRVREVIHNFNRDGLESLSPKFSGRRPDKFDTATRAEIVRVALTRPKTVGRPYTRWSLSKLADSLVEVRSSGTSR